MLKIFENIRVMAVGRFSATCFQTCKSYKIPQFPHTHLLQEVCGLSELSDGSKGNNVKCGHQRDSV